VVLEALRVFQQLKRFKPRQFLQINAVGQPL
jgi:hypothetical protein